MTLRTTILAASAWALIGAAHGDGLRPIEARQYDQLKNLPERSPTLINPNEPDPIGAMIDTTDPDLMTGSIPATEGTR